MRRPGFLLSICITVVWLIAGCDANQSSGDKALSEVQAARQAGLEYLDKNNLPAAETEFKKLIDLAPQEVIGYVNLGIVYLRQGDLSRAQEYLDKALELDPGNITVRLNLYELYQQQDQRDLAEAQLQEILEADPENLFALYKLSQQSQPNPKGSMTELPDYLLKLIEVAPTNIVPRVFLLEYLLENGRYNEAQEQFEDVQSKFERLPEDTGILFTEAYDHLQNSRESEAYTTIVMFHNQLKLTGWYQADVRALRGSEYSQIGVPVISFSRKMVGFGGEEDNLVYQNISFSDVAANAGLNLTPRSDQDYQSFVLSGDLDNDGDLDILLGVNNNQVDQGLLMYRNELGRFEEVLSASGIEKVNNSIGASLADFDNDGFLDILLICENSIHLYHNTDQLKYQDVTVSSGLSEIKGTLVSLFFDADHDGDLDLFLGTSQLDRLFQNNGDGSFTDISNQAGVAGPTGATRDVALGDFDDDGDIDFLVANDRGNRLYSNLRMGRFEEVSAEMGLDPAEAADQVSAGDINNDGLIDLFITSVSGVVSLYQNQNRQGFKVLPEITLGAEGSFFPRVHEFLDYDNDGWLDLVVGGDPTQDGTSGMAILHNNQSGFEDVTRTLPEGLLAVHSLSIGDYNEDSDLDVFTTYRNGAVGLLRNDGGNMNYQLKIQLVGLRQGSGKNNYFGIGSKVEVRAGSLYQMRTITSPNEYFGLGANERADILRIRWTNGVPQNIFSPHSDRDLIEQQQLKGSCPFLYTWNGERYVFVKDMMWRSALGMPLGIMTSDQSRAYAYPDASKEYLKIPGEVLDLEGKPYSVKITGELWETIYLDQLILYAVDHPATTDFLLDEKFVPPPFPKLNLYPVTEQHYPVSVISGESNQREKILKKDNAYISNLQRSRHQGIVELQDLVIDLGAGIPVENLHLILNGWIFPADASINVAVGQSSQAGMASPYLQVLNESGDWVTVIDNLGFPLGKNKTMVTDLSKVFLTNDRKIRIRTSMQIYWDQIFYTYATEPFRRHINQVPVNQANLQFRGFSREYRKGGNYGPHWFDYDKITKEQKWMDLEGDYTRYGDVTDLIHESDNQYIIYNAGDEVSIDFASDQLPEVPEGWTRDFVIYSVGWVKDGDLNTAYGQTVDPLPFHGMSSYPYPEHESYPYAEKSDYLKKYNTRKVDNTSFREWIKTVN